MIDLSTDLKGRLAAFSWLEQQTALYGDVLSRDLLIKGFEFEGARISMISMQGIFQPRSFFVAPLSITTSPNGPYSDEFQGADRIRYRYRGTDPEHRDNRGLRLAWKEKLPLVYFRGHVPGRYTAIWPVYILEDDPRSLSILAVADDPNYLNDIARPIWDSGALLKDSDSRRAYVTSRVRHRLHQHGFRERVIAAYRKQCACCRLRHVELLDAAHIIGDKEPEGEPRVSNGLALCKLHHKAFDVNIMGITPDHRIEIREDVLEEKDGPMLQHGLQGLHNQKIILPTSKEQQPDKLLLEKRWLAFHSHG